MIKVPLEHGNTFDSAGFSTCLFRYFFKIKDQFKTDTWNNIISCLHSECYFDVELYSVEPYIAPDDANFVSVSQPVSNMFFQVYVAPTPRNPMLADNMKK